MGNKYIIEIEEAYAPIQKIATREDFPLLYRVKGFDSLVFDLKGLDKLEKYNPDVEYESAYEQGFAAGQEAATSTEFEDGYEKGLNDAWEAAKKIIISGSSLTWPDLSKVFGTNDFDAIFSDVPANIAISKIKAYEEKQKSEAEIQVGDEVEDMSDEVSSGSKGVVYEVFPGHVNGFSYVAGRVVHFCWRIEDVKKTGRNFSEVAELLKKMKKVKEE